MKPVLFFFAFFYCTFSYGQSCSDLNFQLRSDIGSNCPTMIMTMLHDQQDKDFLYVAHKEAGLSIYDVSNPDNPVLKIEIIASAIGNLDVMNLCQQGNFLFLALGNTFTSNQNAGMAIIDVSNPETAFVADFYVQSNSLGGCGVVATEGNFAYMGAMGNGITTLDVSDKNNIQFVSQFVPAINFPDASPDPAKINARGMTVRNDTLFLCYDAGGFRIIDLSNKFNLSEIGRYSNPVLNGLPRAYNNLSLKGNLAYIAVDYCGVEILDFTSPAAISLKGWWNPYNCPSNNWFSSPVHANEIRLIDECNQLFLSTGKSDMMVLDVSDPTQPDSCNYYGGVANNIGTWGIDIWKNELYLSYVCAIIPFGSSWTGVKCISMNSCTNAIDEFETDDSGISIFPNPFSDWLQISANVPIGSFQCSDLQGGICFQGKFNGESNTVNLNCDQLKSGVYLLSINLSDKIYIRKIVK